jgi:ubiquinone/menaquinone biosynthesis C-methylase UbiE
MRADELKRKERRDYDAVAPYYDASTTPLTDVFGKYAIGLLDVQPRQRVLEVACGTGTLLPELARRVGSHGVITGLDQSARMLALAKARLARYGLEPAAHLIQADAEQLPVAPASFDRMLCMFGLMYLPRPLAALRRMKAALGPGGRAAICVWGLPESVPGLTLPMEVGAQVLTRPPVNWFARTDLGRRLLHRQLLSSKLGGGKSPMSLAPRGRLERLMIANGFTNVRREELSRTFIFADVDEYWDVLMGTPARILVEQYPAASVARAKAEVARLLGERHGLPDRRIGLPMGGVIVTGDT